MNTEYKHLPANIPSLAYVREIAVADLPADLLPQAEGITTLYALHSAEGERLAIVRDREMAFVLARQNDLSPVTAH